MRTAWNKGKPAPWARNNPQTFKQGHRPSEKAIEKNRVRFTGSNNPRWKGGRIEKLICPICSVEFIAKIANKRKFCSLQCLFISRKGVTPYNKGIPNYSKRGENHPNWKGGKGRHDPERKRLFAKMWRQSVFERDNYTCQICQQSSGNLNAHHIKRWQDYPELRFDTTNGITLCIQCHRKINGKEKHYENFFEELLKKAVNSGKTLTDKAEGNPDPSQESNFLEGATTRSRVLIGQ
jgi:hypothetical protein